MEWNSSTTIIEVQGLATAAGCQLACSCDLLGFSEGWVDEHLTSRIKNRRVVWCFQNHRKKCDIVSLDVIFSAGACCDEHGQMSNG